MSVNLITVRALSHTSPTQQCFLLLLTNVNTTTRHNWSRSCTHDRGCRFYNHFILRATTIFLLITTSGSICEGLLFIGQVPALNLILNLFLIQQFKEPLTTASLLRAFEHVEHLTAERLIIATYAATMSFIRWVVGWSTLLWPLTLLTRSVNAISWLWYNYTGKVSIARENSAIADVAKPEQYVRASKGDFLASGASGILERLPSGDVVKSPWPGSGADDCRREIATEYQIYKMLGRHPRLVRIIDWDSEHCVLTMEHMPNGNLKEFLLVNNGTISTAQRLQWAQQAAEGLQLLHFVDVIHCDVEPKNFLLDTNLNLKIADFSGSSLAGSRASACVGKRFSQPDLDWRRPPRVQDDLFGLGSTIYCIMTGQYPFQELASDEVEDHYRAHIFPDVSNVVCGGIIKRCWHSEVTSAQEISDLIKCMV